MVVLEASGKSDTVNLAEHNIKNHAEINKWCPKVAIEQNPYISAPTKIHGMHMLMQKVEMVLEYNILLYDYAYKSQMESLP